MDSCLINRLAGRSLVATEPSPAQDRAGDHACQPHRCGGHDRQRLPARSEINQPDAAKVASREQLQQQERKSADDAGQCTEQGCQVDPQPLTARCCVSLQPPDHHVGGRDPGERGPDQPDEAGLWHRPCWRHRPEDRDRGQHADLAPGG